MRVHGKALTKRAPLLAAAALALAGSALIGAPARAEEDCNWYALTSAKQQQTNEQKNCGLSGEGWSTNTEQHKTWCEAHPDEWRDAVTQRENQLQGCG